MIKDFAGMKKFFEKVGIYSASKNKSDLLAIGEEGGLALEKIKKIEVNVEQCIKDWIRGIKGVVISINGEPLSKLYEKVKGKGGLTKRGKPTTEEKEWLRNIIRSHLLYGIKPERKQNEMLEHLQGYLHQNGYPSILQTALYIVAAEKGLWIINSSISKGLHLIVDGDKIIIDNDLRIGAIYKKDITKPQAEPIDVKGKDPLMTATGRYVLTFDKDGIPKCSIVTITLQHNNKTTLSLLDQQDVLVEVKRFLEDIYKETVKDFQTRKNAKVGMVVSAS